MDLDDDDGNGIVVKSVSRHVRVQRPQADIDIEVCQLPLLLVSGPDIYIVSVPRQLTPSQSTSGQEENTKHPEMWALGDPPLVLQLPGTRPRQRWAVDPCDQCLPSRRQRLQHFLGSPLERQRCFRCCRIRAVDSVNFNPLVPCIHCSISLVSVADMSQSIMYVRVNRGVMATRQSS